MSKVNDKKDNYLCTMTESINPSDFEDVFVADKEPPRPQKRKLSDASEGTSSSKFKSSDDDDVDSEMCRIVFDDLLTKKYPLEAKDEQRSVSPDSQLSDQGYSTKSVTFDSVSEAGQLDDLEDAFDDAWTSQEALDLSTFQRCQVVKKTVTLRELILTLKQDNKQATVKCLGLWAISKVNETNIVSVKADRTPDGWIIDNNAGFLVINPDKLIASTTVVGSLFCQRKGVLSQLFRGVDTLPPYTSDETVMAVGNLVHKILQKALMMRVDKQEDIDAIVEEILKSWSTIVTMYTCNMSLDDCRKHLSLYAQKTGEFINCYIKGKPMKIDDENFKGKIDDVKDIEENIWLPELGIKGKIDVTVDVKDKLFTRVAPLELKTGRTTFSNEHRGQLILYNLMKSAMGFDVDSGLLLYLKENILREVRGTHAEKRDLIMLRNACAYYFTSKVDLDDLTKPMELPEPIHHFNACNRCGYNSLCVAYLSKDKTIKLPASHPLEQLRKTELDHLKLEHVDYVLKWVSLMQLESQVDGDEEFLTQLWTTSPEDRDKQARCLSQMKVISVKEEDLKFRCTFVKANDGKSSVNLNAIFVNHEYVLVSTDKRINVSSAYVKGITTTSIDLLLERDITKVIPSKIFHIDKYAYSYLSAYNMVNVGGLLNNNLRSKRLREIVIDKRPATFTEPLPSKFGDYEYVLRDLNVQQQNAIKRLLTATDYMLIKGMPGTGKTQTIVALVELLQKLGMTVLITAHTNTAVDNILLKLEKRGIDFLRLGSVIKAHPKLRAKSEEYLQNGCQSPEDLERLTGAKTTIGVTCMSSNHPLLAKRSFDICIVDESTQVMQPAVLRPLYNASKFVLLGDPEQLPPIVKHNEGKKHGSKESLFVRLNTPNNTSVLSLQYRMNGRIMQVANALTYDNQLQVGNESVENAVVQYEDISAVESCDEWMRKILSPELDDSVVLVDTGSIKQLQKERKASLNSDDPLCSNIWEVSIIFQLTKVLLKAGVPAQDIGIIAPFRAQVDLLKSRITSDIEINTVDQYQGRDKSIIIYSCTRRKKGEHDKEDILEDHHRLTVAVTRAKNKLIIVADRQILKAYTPFDKLFGILRDRDVMQITDGQEAFSWDKIKL